MNQNTWTVNSQNVRKCSALVGIVVVALLTVQCTGTPQQAWAQSNASSKAPQQTDPQSERNTLVSRLEQKADALRNVNKQEAAVTYLMAHFFADDKVRDGIATKWGTLAVPGRNVPSQLSSTVVHRDGVDLDDCVSDWPKRTLESDVVNLKMLLNENLFDTLADVQLSFSGGVCYLFVATPKMSKAEVETTFGKPTSAREHVVDSQHKAASETLTYGVFKIGVDKNGKANVIMFAGKR